MKLHLHTSHLQNYYCHRDEVSYFVYTKSYWVHFIWACVGAH
jgi:hypothetical protein